MKTKHAKVGPILVKSKNYFFLNLLDFIQIIQFSHFGIWHFTSNIIDLI